MRSACVPACVSVLVFGLLAFQAGFRLNTTTSMPVGLWRIAPPTTLTRGVTVLYCMKGALVSMALERHYLSAGNCPSGVEPMLKSIIAVPGDVVVLAAAGIAVNGEIQRDSAPLPYDLAGRAMPALPFGEYLVANGKIWLLSKHTTNGFDSRYYGPVAAQDITSIAAPVLVVK